jgi:hypothetical protein
MARRCWESQEGKVVVFPNLHLLRTMNVRVFDGVKGDSCHKVLIF